MTALKIAPRGAWKRTALIFAAITYMLTTAGCSVQRSSISELLFWRQDPQAAEVRLFIDDKDCGVLPCLTADAVRDTGILKRSALPVSVASGRFEISLKSRSGRVLSKGLLTLKNVAGNKTVSYRSHDPETVKINFKL